MMNLRMGAGGLLVLLGVAAALLIAALKWLGSNAALISAGIWAAGKVMFAGAVLYAAGTLAWRLHQARQARIAEAEDRIPPVMTASPGPFRVPSRQVPLEQAGEPAALPPGGTHYHFAADMDEETAARLIRLIRGDDRDE